MHINLTVMVLKIAVTSAREHMPSNYIRYLLSAGLEPIVINRFSDLKRLDDVCGVIFSGGGDIKPYFYCEENVGNDFDLYRDILEYSVFRRINVPVLGICRGMQVVNVFCGGTLKDLNTDEHFCCRHAICANANFLQGCKSVNSFHRQCVKDLADCFAPVAYCGDCIEAAVGKNALLVQFHPEKQPLWQVVRYFKELCRNNARCK